MVNKPPSYQSWMTLSGQYVIFYKGQYQIHICVPLPRFPLFTKEPCLSPAPSLFMFSRDQTRALMLTALIRMGGAF